MPIALPKPSSKLGAVPMNGFSTSDVEQGRAGEAALAAKLGTKGGIIGVDISAAIGDGEGRVRERSDWKSGCAVGAGHR